MGKVREHPSHGPDYGRELVAVRLKRDPNYLRHIHKTVLCRTSKRMRDELENGTETQGSQSSIAGNITVSELDSSHDPKLFDVYVDWCYSGLLYTKEDAQMEIEAEGLLTFLGPGSVARQESMASESDPLQSQDGREHTDGVTETHREEYNHAENNALPDKASKSPEWLEFARASLYGRQLQDAQFCDATLRAMIELNEEENQRLGLLHGSSIGKAPDDHIVKVMFENEPPLAGARKLVAHMFYRTMMPALERYLSRQKVSVDFWKLLVGRMIGLEGAGPARKERASVLDEREYIEADK
ncbi:hypothetical protein LTS18_003386 [Coniosporium uncinatum]|uniref:Uncharacterized protein n=1 Tax=Coniosporium uncinatum TaxID=93489 RepID=A0ACC3DZ24_9PEZI|nr:hypothetical protein LTS18_003386 [Coniosporium uncinatum]